MAEIDRYRPEDRRGIEALTRRTLGVDAAEADRLTWDWRYRRNPSSSDQVNLWVAREGPTIVGYLPTMPVRLSVKGLEVAAAWASEPRVAPEREQQGNTRIFGYPSTGKASNPQAYHKRTDHDRRAFHIAAEDGEQRALPAKLVNKGRNAT